MTETNETAPHHGDDYNVLVAHISGAHGVSGGVRLRLTSTRPEATIASLPVNRIVKAVRAEDGLTRFLTIRSLRKQSQPKGAWIANFKDITDRTQAEELLGSELLIREAERAPLPDGEYYVDQVIGLSVITDQGRSLGQVIEVLNAPANDVYITDADALIPAVSEFLLKIDPAAGQILVRDVPGLGNEP